MGNQALSVWEQSSRPARLLGLGHRKWGAGSWGSAGGGGGREEQQIQKRQLPLCLRHGGSGGSLSKGSPPRVLEFQKGSKVNLLLAFRPEKL